MKDYIILTENNFKLRVQKCIDLFFEGENLAQKNIPIEISHRMTRTNGQFEYSRKRNYKNGVADITYNPSKLKFSDCLIDGNYTMSFTDEIIKHEVLHYLVFELGYYTESHGYIFKRYCRKYGCRLTSGSNYNELSNKPKEEQTTRRVANVSKRAKYTIFCSCGFSTSRSKASKTIKNIENYRCPKCKGGLEVIQNY